MATPQELEAARQAAVAEVTRLREKFNTRTAAGARAFAADAEAQAAVAALDAAKSATGLRTAAEDLALLNKLEAEGKTQEQINNRLNIRPGSYFGIGAAGTPTETTIDGYPIGSPSVSPSGIGPTGIIGVTGATGVTGTTETTNVPVTDPQKMMAARDRARLLAEQFGLGGDFFNQIEQLLYEDISEASLILALRSTDAYKKRFAANAARVAKGLPALSEAAYLNTENLYRQELRAAGLPPEFYDSQDDFRIYIENDLGYNEFVSRVGLARRASQMANPEVKMQLKNLYGVGDNELVAYFLNPQKTTTMLQRQFNVAQTAGALSRAGFGTGMAEDLTTAVVGGRPETTLDYKELQQSAETAAAFRPISEQVLGGERGAVTESDLLTGIVAEDVQSQRRLQREQQRRLAEYQGGGGLMESQQGVLGLRSATR
jgi:hypothetical protein